MKSYNNNVANELDDIYLIQNEIIDAGSTIDDMILHLFSFLKHAALEVAQLCDLAKKKFLNLTASNKWGALNSKDTTDHCTDHRDN